MELVLQLLSRGERRLGAELEIHAGPEFIRLGVPKTLPDAWNYTADSGVSKEKPALLTALKRKVMQLVFDLGGSLFQTAECFTVNAVWGKEAAVLP
jgi:hypothetical protein